MLVSDGRTVGGGGRVVKANIIFERFDGLFRDGGDVTYCTNCSSGGAGGGGDIGWLLCGARGVAKRLIIIIFREIPSGYWGWRDGGGEEENLSIRQRNRELLLFSNGCGWVRQRDL